MLLDSAILILLISVVALAAAVRFRGRPSLSETSPSWLVSNLVFETLTEPPAFDARRCLLSSDRTKLLHQLRNVVPSEVVVFAQVPLQQIATARKSNSSWIEHRNKCARQTVDFVLCAAADTRILLVIQLGDTIGRNAAQLTHGSSVDAVLQSCGVPVLRIASRELWEPSTLHAEIIRAMRSR